MQQLSPVPLDEWLEFLTQAEIPVLRTTGEQLTALREDEDALSARAIARIVLRDPCMTAKLLRYLQISRTSQQKMEIIQVEQALLMLGMRRFFAAVPTHPEIDSLLSSHPEALQHLEAVIERAFRAAQFAVEWAVRLNDLRFDEVYIAALLHDLAEMLLWCFAPQPMLLISQRQELDKSLRSHVAQEQVLGFSIHALQHELVHAWSLPKLLVTLMDDTQLFQPRVRNVLLAVNLARHSAHGWDDAALPDDYEEISALLHLPVDQIHSLVHPAGWPAPGTVAPSPPR